MEGQENNVHFSGSIITIEMSLQIMNWQGQVDKIFKKNYTDARHRNIKEI
ncbi:predicted protein [Coccidioides posadasii str. Silveira]|uniref:Predicted protein n=1 Tax=Coccidioides posadasii (strain RMSCC 757 / Silveira) TaxID=443226 RepID=E9D7F4_COCPS|nr:predicted protein [Coccidioides posadasii str. Silveira]